MIAEYKGADDDIVRWQSADGTVKTAHINDLISAYEPKRGKWIAVFIEYTDGSTGARAECPFCKERQLTWTNYCPNCGERMENNAEEIL